MSVFSPIYLWYQVHKRNLPWRATNNPYLIWLSEVILQQTRVNQGMPYYYKFIEAYPTVVDLANADMDEVLKLWQGLGYYNRAANMVHTAQLIRDQYKGVFPNEYESLISLKGIGSYTAAAIASFAYNLPYAVVDGNVYRVISRVLGIEEDIASTHGKKVFAEIATQFLNVSNPALHNQAMMEFGAIICTPKQPLCTQCVLQSSCYAFAHQKITELPVKSAKKKPVNKHFHYVLNPQFKTYIYLRKRTGSGIWKGLYELPLFETDKLETVKKTQELIQHQFKLNKSQLKLVYQQKHILTHQIIAAKFWCTQINEQILLDMGYQKVAVNNILSYPVPRLLEKFFNDILLLNSTQDERK